VKVVVPGDWHNFAVCEGVFRTLVVN
jgi:hypothetical protein